MPFEIEGRKIKIVTGSKSQTVNVYVDNDQEGMYNPKLRITDPKKFVNEQILKDKSFSSIQEMKNYLQEKHEARTEDMTQVNRGKYQQYRSLIPIDHAWIENIIPEVEKAINSLIDEFIAIPYLHRVAEKQGQVNYT